MAAKKKTRSYNLLLVGVFSLLAVGSWISFDVYRSFTNTTLTEVQQQLILPLRVNIDDELVDTLVRRRQIEDFTLNAVQSRGVPIVDRGVVVATSSSESVIDLGEEPIVATDTGGLVEEIATESGGLTEGGL